jgi:hypothetical protein
LAKRQGEEKKRNAAEKRKVEKKRTEPKKYFFDPVALRVVASRHPSKQRKIRSLRLARNFEKFLCSFQFVPLLYFIRFSLVNNNKIVKIEDFINLFGLSGLNVTIVRDLAAVFASDGAKKRVKTSKKKRLGEKTF